LALRSRGGRHAPPSSHIHGGGTDLG
jgi:hypothetical protein